MAYRIKTVAEMTGVPRQTLLSWERRYGLPRPDRAANGYRVYSEHDVALIVRIEQLREQGHAVSEAVGMLALREQPVSDAPSVEAVPELCAALVDALVAFNREEAERIDNRVNTLAMEARLDDVYLPALRELGQRWHEGTVTIGQEHFGSFFLRERLVGMVRALGSGPGTGPTAVCAGIPGELHEFGLLAASIKLALRGWRVLYLGPDMPTPDLVAIVTDRRAQLVCQSVMLQRPGVELAQYATDLVERLPPQTRLALGGPGVASAAPSHDPRLLYCASFDELAAMLTVKL